MLIPSNYFLWSGARPARCSGEMWPPWLVSLERFLHGLDKQTPALVAHTQQGHTALGDLRP